MPTLVEPVDTVPTPPLENCAAPLLASPIERPEGITARDPAPSTVSTPAPVLPTANAASVVISPPLIALMEALLSTVNPPAKLADPPLLTFTWARFPNFNVPVDWA